MKQQHISGGTMCSTLENFFKIAVFAVGIFIIWGWGNSLEVRADSDEKNLKNCLAGTYLIEEGSGTRGLWEFSKDGNFTGTSSAQPSTKLQYPSGNVETERKAHRQSHRVGFLL